MCPIYPPDHRKTPLVWIVDDDGDVFLGGMGVKGTPIDPKHIRCGPGTRPVLIYCPPLDAMAPPERKTVYVDVMSTSPEEVGKILEGDDRYPHSCPRCGGAAYVGLFSVDCKGKCPA